MTLPLNAGDDAPRRPWFDDDAIAAGDGSADFTPSLVSIGFIRAALRRSAWFCRIMAVIGLLAGAGLYLKSPPTYQASTTLLLTVGPETQPGEAILNDQTMAQSPAVAGLAVHNLGLRQSVSSFLGSYKVTAPTDRVLQITASAPSSNEAVRRANVLAQAFLTYRADVLQTQEQLESAGYDQQVTLVKDTIKSISDQISQLAAQSVSSSQQAKLSALRAQHDAANSDLTALEQSVAVDEAAAQVSTGSMIGQSKVLDIATPLAPHSRSKHLALYAVGGFMIGLILGVSIVVVRALVSDRLRRRDDVARALGAPVKLSVSGLRVKRRFLGRPGLAAARSRGMQRIVAYLRDAVPEGSPEPVALAVVPADDPQVAALCVASLAVSRAQQGKRVVVADLCGGAPAAMLLGARNPGVHMVSLDGAELAVAVPDPDEVAPAGPFSPTSPQAQPELAGQVAAACKSADVLFTLVTLDPSVGGDHLATWASHAVVVITAGRSSWMKVQAVGEMIRLAGTRLISAVLVGADKTDESLGVAPAPEADGNAVPGEALTWEGPHFNRRGSSVTGDAGPRGDPSDQLPASTRFMS